jgi:hypothetical protein
MLWTDVALVWDLFWRKRPQEEVAGEEKTVIEEKPPPQWDEVKVDAVKRLIATKVQKLSRVAKPALEELEPDVKPKIKEFKLCRNVSWPDGRYVKGVVLYGEDKHSHHISHAADYSGAAELAEKMMQACAYEPAELLKMLSGLDDAIAWCEVEAARRKAESTRLRRAKERPRVVREDVVRQQAEDVRKLTALVMYDKVVNGGTES